MTRRKRRPAPRKKARAAAPRTPAAGAAERHQATGPTLTGGDLDADWQRAAQVGEEAVGGTAATPDQDVIDDLGAALGVPQPPDAEFRPSAEVLQGRDRRRWEQEP